MILGLMKSKKARIILGIIFCVYLVVLARVILFKYPLHMILTILSSDETLLSRRIDNSNFIPMKTIINYLSGNQSLRISAMNLLGNIAAFMPWGFLLPIIFEKMGNFKAVLFSSFLLSLFFEMVQLLTGIGEFDVDDILLNVLGAIGGYLIYRLVIRFISEKKFFRDSNSNPEN